MATKTIDETNEQVEREILRLTAALSNEALNRLYCQSLGSGPQPKFSPFITAALENEWEERNLNNHSVI